MSVLTKNCLRVIIRNVLIKRMYISSTGSRFLSTRCRPASEEHQNSTIPIIDLGKLGLTYNPDPNDKEWHRVAEEVADAFKNIGFAYITGHGIPETFVQRVRTAAEAFFALPVEEKEKFVHDLENGHGYMPTNWEEKNTKPALQLRESFEFKHEGLPFPDDKVPELKPASVDFLKSCQNLSVRMFQAMALGLDLPRNFFLDNHQHVGGYGNRTHGRVLHYPPVPREVLEKVTRTGSHTDFGTLTFLFQDEVGGLQIRDKNEEWIDATPIPGAIVVNIGDFLEFWTSGRFKATEHRVIIPEEQTGRNSTRLSVVYFMQADNNVVIRPLDGSSAFEPVRAIDHLQKRFAKSYSHLSKESK